MYLGLKWVSIGYYKSGASKLVVENLLMANGVNMSPDKKFVYTPNVNTRSIDVYKRNSDNSLDLVQVFTTYVLCDNIDVHRETGDLWTGCISQGHRMLKYLKDPREPSPSKIMKLSTKNGLITGMSEIYCGDGEGYRGGTVGVRYKDHMLGGAVLTSPLYCQLNYVTP